MARQVKMGFGEEVDDEERQDSDTDYASSDDEASGRRRRHILFCAIVGPLACLSCTVVLTLVLAPFIGKAVAERVIEGLNITFTSIDMGSINGTGAVYPHVTGHVSQRSPFPAVLLPGHVVLKASTEPTHAGDEGMAEVGSAALPEIRVNGNQEIALDLTIEFRVTDPRAFGRAGRRFIAADRTFWSIEGGVDVKCWIFGHVPMVIKGIALRKPIQLQGLGGFSQDVNHVEMQSVTDARGDPGALTLTVSIQLQNPSYVAARITRSMQFLVMQRGQMFGTALIEDLSLQLGRNVILLRFVLANTATNEDAIRAFILGYIKAEVQPVTVFGSEGSTSDPFLSAILGGLNATFNFQPPPTQFIRAVEANIGLGVRARASIYNPLPQAITMGDVDLNIEEENKYGHLIFRLRTEGSITNLPGAVLQPKQTSTLDIQLNPFDAKLTDFQLLGRLLKAAEAGRLAVRVSGPVTITIQPSFTVTVDYSADNITAVLKCPFLCR
mmetsp:Transcript_80301/g.239139  ORF Transcript_80301/g.239139 Transcript_80301/m.239139 type:complete len:497 (-) Transcript_80301:28-1518(-)